MYSLQRKMPGGISSSNTRFASSEELDQNQNDRDAVETYSYRLKSEISNRGERREAFDEPALSCAAASVIFCIRLLSKILMLLNTYL